MLRHFISYYKPYKGLFALDMLASLLIAAADLFYPMIARNIINDYVPNRNLRLLIIWLGALLLIYLSKMLLNYFVQYMGHVMGTRMQGDMRRDMFRHLQKLPLSFFDENKTGNIMSRIINDLFDVSELAHHGPENLFLCVVMFIGSFTIMGFIYSKHGTVGIKLRHINSIRQYVFFCYRLSVNNRIGDRSRLPFTVLIRTSSEYNTC